LVEYARLVDPSIPTAPSERDPMAALVLDLFLQGLRPVNIAAQLEIPQHRFDSIMRQFLMVQLRAQLQRRESPTRPLPEDVALDRPQPRVVVATVRMESPLDVVLEIPAVVWLTSGLAFLALTERLATMPVRIARKRKDELLKIAVAHVEMQRLKHQADVLAKLLQQQGAPPDQVTFTTPGEPGDELTVSEITTGPDA
jgi:hypothetical protein